MFDWLYSSIVVLCEVAQLPLLQFFSSSIFASKAANLASIALKLCFGR